MLKGKKILVVSSEEFFVKLYEDGYKDFAKRNKLTLDIFVFSINAHKFPYLKKIWFKKNINGYKVACYDKKREELCGLVDEYDIILFLNLPYDGECLIKGELKRKLANKDCRLQFVDTLKNCPPEIDFWNIFRKIFSFEATDVEYGKKAYGIDVIPYHSSTCYYLYNNHQLEDNYDVCFVGISTAKRLIYLDKLAEWCNNNNKKLWVSGNFWNNSHWWSDVLGEARFKHKHKILHKYTHNIFINPKELAKKYLESKIVINVNVAYHKDFNERIFDIMACRRLCITDELVNDDIDLHANKDFIMIRDENEMIMAIDYYLKNKEEREKIASNGYTKTMSNHLRYLALERIFE